VADESLRLFIALQLPEPVKDSIREAQAELRAALPEHAVRWTRAEQLHVTLRFLGEVDRSRTEALVLSVARACDGFGAVGLRAAGLGMFPDARRPRVIWVGVSDPAGRLTRLQRAIEAAAAAFTAEKPERTFTGHVTIGRCRDMGRRDVVELRTLGDAMQRRQFGEWTADRVDIVRSELGPGGSRHTTFAALNLGPA
jgi:2'-5' RNA ligase